LDRLHDELALISKDDGKKQALENADEWHEVGQGNQ